MKTVFFSSLLCASLALFACGGEDDEIPNDGDAQASSSSGDQASSSGGNGSSSGNQASSSSGETPAGDCEAAYEQALQVQSTVSTGVVSAVADTPDTYYIDAEAGGSGPSANNPRVYVNLETRSKVEISDEQARTSTEWDLAFKRMNIFNNSGSGGPGEGGTLVVAKPFDEVSAADASGDFATETFFDEEECELRTALQGTAVDTTLFSWFSYATGHVSVVPDRTFVVRGATGSLYKVGFLSYEATPTAPTGGATGRYHVRIAALAN